MPENYAFAMHGGAGPVAGRDYSVVEEHLRELAEEGKARLEAGGKALDVVEYAVAEMESSMESFSSDFLNLVERDLLTR